MSPSCPVPDSWAVSLPESMDGGCAPTTWRPGAPQRRCGAGAPSEGLWAALAMGTPRPACPGALPPARRGRELCTPHAWPVLLPRFSSEGDSCMEPRVSAGLSPPRFRAFPAPPEGSAARQQSPLPQAVSRVVWASPVSGVTVAACIWALHSTRCCQRYPRRSLCPCCPPPPRAADGVGEGQGRVGMAALSDSP